MTLHVAICCLSAHILPQIPYMLPPCAMKTDYGKLRHFCDDPVCHDPIRRLSRNRKRNVRKDVLAQNGKTEGRKRKITSVIPKRQSGKRPKRTGQPMQVHTWHYRGGVFFHRMPFPVESKFSGWKASGRQLFHQAKIADPPVMPFHWRCAPSQFQTTKEMSKFGTKSLRKGAAKDTGLQRNGSLQHDSDEPA